MPILYSFRRCPYAMRARLALYSAKIAHEHREVDLKNKPAEMLAISPKGTVPVLQLEDGTVLEQSLDIMSFAMHQPDLSLIDTQLITENDTVFKQALDRYKYPGRYVEEEGADYRTECEQFLKKIEARLNPFLTGDSIGFVDIAIFPLVRQCVMVEPDWFNVQLSPHYPRLKAWLDTLIASALFKDIMADYTPWKPGDTPVLVTF